MVQLAWNFFGRQRFKLIPQCKPIFSIKYFHFSREAAGDVLKAAEKLQIAPSSSVH